MVLLVFGQSEKREEIYFSFDFVHSAAPWQLKVNSGDTSQDFALLPIRTSRFLFASCFRSSEKSNFSFCLMFSFMCKIKFLLLGGKYNDLTLSLILAL